MDGVVFERFADISPSKLAVLGLEWNAAMGRTESLYSPERMQSAQEEVADIHRFVRNPLDRMFAMQAQDASYQKIVTALYQVTHPSVLSVSLGKTQGIAAEVSGALASYVNKIYDAGFIGRPEGMILDLDIRPDFEGSGIKQKVFETVVDDIRGMGVNTFYASARSDEPGEGQFFKEMGGTLTTLQAEAHAAGPMDIYGWNMA